MSQESMFGLTPYEVRQGRNAQDADYADKMALATPYQKADTMLGRGGAGIGRLAGGMLGMVDPLEQKAKVMEGIQAEIAQSGIQDESEIFKVAANRLRQAGYAKEAMEALLLHKKASEAKSKAAQDKRFISLGAGGLYNTETGETVTPTAKENKEPTSYQEWMLAKNQDGYKGSYASWKALSANIAANAIAPLRSAQAENIEAENRYNLPQPRSSFSVTTPDGQIFLFPNRQAANKFKAATGGK